MLNPANARMQIFTKDDDFIAFEAVNLPKSNLRKVNLPAARHRVAEMHSHEFAPDSPEIMEAT